MAQLRQLVAQNPALIQPLIQQIVASNPQAAQALNENPDLIFQILGGLEGEDFPGGGEGGEGGEGAVQIEVTPEDAEAIGRLEALGFSREQATMAYLSCDKNENLAANFLFEGGFNDED